MSTIKNLLFSATLALGCLHLSAQDVYLNCDFESGIPSTFSLYDEDGLLPSTDMQNLGFSIGTPWITTSVEENMVAVSTSWYKHPGTSNDWMVLPGLTINSEKAVITWRAMASDSQFRDGYKLYISEQGNQPADFNTDTPFLTVAKEQNQWKSYSQSLADYVGKTIYIAFVNDSKDKTMLYVDDIFVGVPSCVGFTMNAAQRVLTEYGDVTLSGKVSATLDKTITSYTIGYEAGDQHFEQQFTKTIRPGNSVSFMMDMPLHIERGQTLNYKAWVEAEGDRQELQGKVSAYAHHVVAEEVTGTWCGYCVRGIVAMEQATTTYPKNFIGLAIHNNDPMALGDQYYLDPVMSDMGFGGFPNACVNRNNRYKGDPSDIPANVTTLLGTAPDYDIVLNASYDADTKQMTAHCDLYSSKNVSDADLRVAFITVEDSVHGTNAEQYYQQNYYSGVSGMGRFSSLPAVVSANDMWYMDVVRGIEGTHTGISGLLPSTLEEDGIYSLDHTFTFTADTCGHFRPEMCSLVVLLFNGKNNHILNADKLSLAELLAGGAGISATRNDEENECVIYSLDGRFIARGRSLEELRRQGYRGVAVVNDQKVIL